MIRLFIILFSTLLLWSCATPDKPQTNAIKTKPTSSYAQTTKKNSAYYLSQAELYGAGEDQRSFYILAAKSAIAEQQSPLFISSILNNVDHVKRNSVLLDIELAKSLLYVNYVEEAQFVVQRLRQGQVSRRHQVALNVISAQLTSLNDEHVQTVRTLFQLLAFYPKQISDADKVLIYELIWRHILNIPPSTLYSFIDDFGDASNAWIDLANVIQQHLSDANQLPKELNRWQNIYPSAINYDLLPDQIQQLLITAPYNPKTIALLLPLSGRLAKQSQAIRDGFLTAMNFTADHHLIVLDTDLLSLQEIEQQIEQNQVEFIVGPLEKERVSQFAQSEILRMLPRLNLNIPELIPNRIADLPMSYYYSLAPEDEIEQAIEYFVMLGIQRPAVIYADNRLGRRLFNRFNAAWQEATEQQAEAIAFRNKSKLGNAVQQLLDVDASRTRIQQMKKIFGAALETETRSRTDIDAVYVIANSQQTRLIKPFFDVNISAFGRRLPIYASSRSYLVDESIEQKRDLNGMVFTEMPWLIENTEPRLHQIYATIGQQQTQLKKLFAFGHDAFDLIFALKQLQILPEQHIEALTGKLSVKPNMTIKRKLSWSRYTRGKVIALPEPKQTHKGPLSGQR